ncbi:MAG: hypothetical protein UY07_C0002G0049 [Parcubacteria group bacterium GW2011_GWA1_47_8]|nr:MAG: hypothetical protein UY07_C0002G0049 [Parcubacteria group bacterium GW2011_GWA1_47_8]
MISLTNLKEKRENGLAHNRLGGGFTLLELLIVIAIIAILSIALVFMLNPAETLKKARDAQRISDLKSVKTALGIMLTASSTPSLDNFGVICTTTTTPAGATTLAAAPKIRYSANVTPTLGGTLTAGSDSAFTPWVSTSGAPSGTTAGKVDGTGWIPVNLKALTGGTPISSFPVDPTNSITTTATASDLVYRYACQNGTTASVGAGKPAYVFEIDAVLESNAYTVDDNKMTKDGGDNDDKYESGNSLNLLPLTGALF